MRRKGENQSLEIGSNSFIPGFETQCIGAKAARSAIINVTFLKTTATRTQGKAACLRSKVHEVRKRSSRAGRRVCQGRTEFDTLEEYRQSNHNNIMNRKTEAVRNEFLEALLEKIVDGMTAELPDAMIGNAPRE